MLVAVRTEEEGEPAFAHLDEGPLDLVASCLQHGFQLVQRDLLLLFVPCDRIGLFAQLGFELFVGAQQFEALFVERGGSLAVQLAEHVAIPVARQDSQLRHGRPERQLLALERQTRGQDRILELVVSLRELGGD